ncbi:MAG: LAGLIDADG family homing endonuclease [Candidatus Diapherotrites archaeon]|nr:LAGLIDADG family homing endonuclease [Candidatus Diapherotrites archaeon]
MQNNFNTLHDANFDLINQIQKIRVNGNLQTMRKQIGSENLKSLLIAFYPKYNITEIQEIIGVPDSTVERWLKQLGVELTRNHITNLVVPANFESSVVLTERSKSTKISAITIDEGLSYLVGFCIGDGSVQKFCIEVFNKDSGMKEHLAQVMKRYGKVGESIRQNGLWKLRLSSVKIADLIKRNKSIRQDTIDYILTNDKLARQFLAGLWDAEGSVLKQGKYFHIYLYNSDKNLIDNISEFLNSVGIENSIIPMKKRNKEYNLNGRIIVPRKTVYRLGIPKKHFKQWGELIGLHLKHSKKAIMVKEILKGDC